MTESMAKQFGDFCDKFIEYYTSIPSLGIQKFLRIRVCLDVTAPLKRKNCYCPFRLQLEPSKIVFGWDLSLHAVVKRRNTTVSRWLRAADGSPYITENLVSSNHGISINEGKYLGRNFRRFVGNKNSNPNLIPLGSVQYHGNNRKIKGRDGGNDALGADGLVYGPWTWSWMRRMAQLLYWKVKRDRELWRAHVLFWMLLLDQAQWMYRLTLVIRAAEVNENT
ncbi:hypothetical protein Gotri_021036, partial [Gossypium trilobum]|nr:hypothetical protein [Gossypium trilobum]